ncbi:hypothetical protein CEXT_336651 [Caerostris extrusa]|uniref:Uncharacterized protein n=1 Tax=Caerostris extrusa TaxID=172846 RepID=A0AAV4XXQ1_CAEEX|nr:hypothetical protein CEXT_336651 [Caerostris extrusa]
MVYQRRTWGERKTVEKLSNLQPFQHRVLLPKANCLTEDLKGFSNGILTKEKGIPIIIDPTYPSGYSTPIPPFPDFSGGFGSLKFSLSSGQVE